MTELSISLEKKELELLLQSLDHCLATCTKKSTTSASCGDCDRARALRQRLANLLTH